MAGATLLLNTSARASWFALAIVWVAVWPQWGDSRHSRLRLVMTIRGYDLGLHPEHRQPRRSGGEGDQGQRQPEFEIG